jgi:hypothetical protein
LISSRAPERSIPALLVRALSQDSGRTRRHLLGGRPPHSLPDGHYRRHPGVGGAGRGWLAGAAYLPRGEDLGHPILSHREQAPLQHGCRWQRAFAVLSAGRWEERDLTRAPEAIHYFGGFSPNGERVAFAASSLLARPLERLLYRKLRIPRIERQRVALQAVLLHIRRPLLFWGSNLETRIIQHRILHRRYF